MMSIEQALGEYTDLITAGKPINSDYFKDNLAPGDYKEFLEIIPFVKVLNASRTTTDFDKLMEKIHKAREEFAIEFPAAAGFRSTGGAGDKEAEDTLDAIFNEEFGDDH